ncbi:hypothetical protein MP638_003527 [Amoeboaphelidium occidentale]|nr:hypothetical protein MP638_003527 [Amoeboaphelidium occidentale]
MIFLSLLFLLPLLESVRTNTLNCAPELAFERFASKLTPTPDAVVIHGYKESLKIAPKLYSLDKDPESLEMIYTMADISGLAYLRSEMFQQVSDNDLRAGKFKVLKEGIQDSYGHLYVIVQNLELNYTALVVRGSQTLDDWKVNLQTDLIPFTSKCRSCRVHEGFYERYKEIRNDLFNQTFQMNTKFFIVGHSLGASVALLLALDYQPDFLYTFALPVVGNRNFKEHAKAELNRRWINVVNEGDWAPYIAENPKIDCIERRIIISKNGNKTKCNDFKSIGCEIPNCDQMDVRMHSKLGPMFYGSKSRVNTRPIHILKPVPTI